MANDPLAHHILHTANSLELFNKGIFVIAASSNVQFILGDTILLCFTGLCTTLQKGKLKGQLWRYGETSVVQSLTSIDCRGSFCVYVFGHVAMFHWSDLIASTIQVGKDVSAHFFPQPNPRL